MSDNIKISDFFDKEYVKSATYDTLRNLASMIDGLKISERKAVWVALTSQSFKHIKVSQFASKVSEATCYIHGEGSLQTVITNLGKNYVGSNNLSLFEPDANFGSRFVHEASAPRYIFVARPKILDTIFNKDDIPVLETQTFEGSEIEPIFLLPVLPIQLINGSDGIGTGFKQTILPRNPIDIINIVKAILNEKPEEYENIRILPWYRGFNGKIRRSDDNSAWLISGHAYYKNTTTIIIDEIPVNYSLNSYNQVLEKLQESNKYIRSYTDLSENDNFLFEVKVAREMPVLEGDDLLNFFKLIKRESEIFSCINRKNQVVDVSDNVSTEIDVLKAFVTVKLEYIQRRKEALLDKYMREIKLAKNKIEFIKLIHNGDLDIKKKTQEIVAVLEANNFDKINGDYSYLLDLKIHTLTNDKYNELKIQCKNIICKYKQIKESTPKDMFLKDLDDFQEEWKKYVAQNG